MDRLVSLILIDSAEAQILTWSRIWNGIVFVGLLTTYFPRSHPRLEGMSRAQILARIDYVGAVLSIVGITLL